MHGAKVVTVLVLMWAVAWIILETSGQGLASYIVELTRSDGHVRAADHHSVVKRQSTSEWLTRHRTSFFARWQCQRAVERVRSQPSYPGAR